MQWAAFLSLPCGGIALLYGARSAFRVLKKPDGDAAMRKVSEAIRQGSEAYLKRQYTTVAYVGAGVAVLLWFLLGTASVLGFVFGAVLSAFSGVFGMFLAVRANVRTAEAAKTNLCEASDVAFEAGSATGLLIGGVALLGLGGAYGLLTCYALTDRALMEPLIAMGFGASLISIFARLGGGIYTKGADVGADLVGKVENNIPEDDIRNPAVIADNVGDNVGDCAGMAADVFETYVVTLVASMQTLALSLNHAVQASVLLAFPLGLGAMGLLASVLGMGYVRLSPTDSTSQHVTRALYLGLWTTLGAAAVLFVLFTQATLGLSTVLDVAATSINGWHLVYCAWIGLAVTAGLFLATEYYTSTAYRPVRSIARASKAGAGSNVIQGLAVSWEACVLPALIIVFGILSCYVCADLIGIAIGATAMMSVGWMVMAIDAYGPITDNAGGIAEMAHLSSDVRKVTDILDAVGNTTKAVTKGYAVGSAGLAALVLFNVYVEDVALYFPRLSNEFRLSDPFVLIGLLLGGMLPCAFVSMSMRAVSEVSFAVIEEVRKQFREIPGIMEGLNPPLYGRAVDILTKASIRAMVVPSLLPVVVPVAVFMALRWTVGAQEAVSALGGILTGVLITGLFLAISMTAGGGAWDNAKKLVEMNPEGAWDGKGSETHKAAVIGDTVGDPCKDTAGPALNPFIKIVNIVAILLLACSKVG